MLPFSTLSLPFIFVFLFLFFYIGGYSFCKSLHLYFDACIFRFRSITAYDADSCLREILHKIPHILSNLMYAFAFLEFTRIFAREWADTCTYVLTKLFSFTSSFSFPLINMQTVCNYLDGTQSA